MAFKYTGDATLGVALTVETPKPLDNRTVVNNLDELYSIPEKYAYQGMTVANIDNGNIYMLIDKSKIKYKEGWKASYESIQIITCTEAEYKEWSENTTENFKPIDENKTYLHAETYYYIYEDSLNDDQFYLSAEWGKKIEEQLKQKALNTTVVQIKTDLDQTISNLSKYATLEELTENYTPKTDLDLEDPESLLSKALSNHYTKEETDDIFVTKESLRGEGMEGDNFVFVTKKQYDEDQQSIQEELDKTLKLDGEGSLDSITVGQIKSPVVEGEEQIIVDVTSEGLKINGDTLAVRSEIPVIVTMSKAEYDILAENNELDEETYYYLYNTEEDLVYVTNKDLKASYHTIGQYQSWVAGYGYSRVDIDNIVASLQGKGDYVLLTQLENYYDKTETNEIFLNKTEASETYATGDALSQLAADIESNYVTKDSLKSEGSEDEDFIFVTQKTYQEDKDTNATEFSSDHLVTSKITINGGVELTTEEQRLIHNGEKIALTKELHKVECMSEEEYLKLVEEEKTVEDTYYYTYGQNENAATGYVQLGYIEDTYYTKRQVDAIIKTINGETSELVTETIANLQTQLSDLENKLQTQLDKLQIHSEVTEHILSLNDNDIMVVENKVLHILSASKVSVNGLQIIVD